MQNWFRPDVRVHGQWQYSARAAHYVLIETVEWTGLETTFYETVDNVNCGINVCLFILDGETGGGGGNTDKSREKENGTQRGG